MTHSDTINKEDTQSEFDRLTVAPIPYSSYFVLQQEVLDHRQKIAKLTEQLTNLTISYNTLLKRIENGSLSASSKEEAPKQEENGEKDGKESRKEGRTESRTKARKSYRPPTNASDSETGSERRVRKDQNDCARSSSKRQLRQYRHEVRKEGEWQESH